MKQEFVSFTLAIQVKENCLFIAKHENLLLIQLLWLGLVSVWICLLANSLKTRDVCFVLFCCDWCTISAWNANSLRLIYWMRSEWNKKITDSKHQHYFRHQTIHITIFQGIHKCVDKLFMRENETFSYLIRSIQWSIHQITWLLSRAHCALCEMKQWHFFFFFSSFTRFEGELVLISQFHFDV